ncbi:MAG: aminotransferase class V-fold PLP-dependent enzyme [Byssovorax sp.]
MRGGSSRGRWTLDPAITFLNHGSFGACPTEVLEVQSAVRARLEREPVRFFLRESEAQIEEARAALGALIGAEADDLAVMSNATAGVNTVLRSLDLAPGDELLTTNHAYNACRNALEYVAERAGASVVVARVPFPIASADDVVHAVLACVTPRTRLALLDHITSPTALIFPLDRLVAELAARGVDALVDAAHAPGMVPMNLRATGAAFTAGNLHKWLCAPKGAAFLHVRRDRQAGVRPLSISHGANARRADRSRFRLEFDWTGTEDPSAFLAVPAAIRFLEGLVPGGLPALMAENHRAALAARQAICAATGTVAACPDAMVGSMASVLLPGPMAPLPSALSIDPLQEALFARFAIEIPVFPWFPLGQRMVRVSTPFYVDSPEIDVLTAALRALGVG